jgi:hypothetical protein
LKIPIFYEFFGGADEDVVLGPDAQVLDHVPAAAQALLEALPELELNFVSGEL